MRIFCATPVLQVKNLDEALTFYTQVLGFKEDFVFGGNYAGVSFGKVHLNLCQHQVHNKPIGGGAVCFSCDEVDGYFESVKEKATVQFTPEDRPYGLRDFAIQDPDGNSLSFGCEIKTVV